MQASIAAIFPTVYDARQTASAMVHIGRVDPLLIADGTLFIIEDETGIVASGGWSRRAKLYSGSMDQEGHVQELDPVTDPARVRAMFVRGDRTRRGLGTRILVASEDAARQAGYRSMSLMATLPGVPLYARYGFVARQAVPVTMADGVTIDCVIMERPIAPVG